MSTLPWKSRLCQYSTPSLGYVDIMSWLLICSSSCYVDIKFMLCQCSTLSLGYVNIKSTLCPLYPVSPGYVKIGYLHKMFFFSFLVICSNSWNVDFKFMLCQFQTLSLGYVNIRYRLLICSSPWYVNIKFMLCQCSTLSLGYVDVKSR